MAKANKQQNPQSKTIIAVIVGLILLGVVVLVVVNSLNKKGSINTVAQDTIANAPAGCPKSTSIVVKSKEAGTQNITSSNSNFLHWRSDQAMLVFTNYTLNPDDVYADITGDRVLTVINLSHKDSSLLKIGTYSKTTTTADPSSLNQYASEFNISTAGLAGAVFDSKATVEITYMGDNYVCGTVTSNDGSSSITGEFIAKNIKKF